MLSWYHIIQYNAQHGHIQATLSRIYHDTLTCNELPLPGIFLKVTTTTPNVPLMVEQTQYTNSIQSMFTKTHSLTTYNYLPSEIYYLILSLKSVQTCQHPSVQDWPIPTAAVEILHLHHYKQPHRRKI